MTMKCFEAAACILACIAMCIGPSQVFAHGDISKFPPSVQILQYNMVLFMNPDDLETRNKLGMAYWLAGQMEEAQKQFEKVLKKDSRNFNALDGLGLVFMKKNALEKAMQYFNIAEKVNSSDILVHVHKAVVFEKMGRKVDAEQEFSRAKTLAQGPADKQKIKDEIKMLTKSGAERS